ncbi:prepilin-type N-terminal cleavage/methylation domain-containing protein [candidate division WOR-3 bacterium]|nr:prepilin-type N-terminal cleavage/methylation domain-containing protein [candidate division WOR-3 bacterium]
MKNRGFTLIELLVVILIIGILLALIIPNFVLFQERARRSSVKNNMHVIQTSLEAYSVDHYGNYPNEDVSWEAFDETGICLWFPGGDPIGLEGEPKPGNFPVNPYDGKRYNDEEKDVDLDYEENYGAVDEPGMLARKLGIDEDCPYLEFGEVPEYPGGIGIATYVPEVGDYSIPQEYGIYGFGRDITFPMYDLDPLCDDPTSEDFWIFFVLHN